MLEPIGFPTGADDTTLPSRLVRPSASRDPPDPSGQSAVQSASSIFSEERTMRMCVALAAWLVCAGLSVAADEASPKDEARLLRFPTIHDKQIVFTYVGDLYTVPSTGGVA